ncbi:MAG: glycosyltransferase family 4 protein [Verrucomicrobiae bacterium]|nr:glycosyltransferase family 4 protein [Verrucomicrobiae bacterium]
MKILFCTHEPFWPLTGGGTSGTLAVVNELKRLGHEVTVMAPAHASCEEIERRWEITFIPFNPFYMHRNASLRTLRYILYSLLFVPKLLFFLRQKKVDVLIGKNVVLTPALRVAGSLYEIPSFVVTTDLLTLYFGFSKAFFQKWMARLIALEAWLLSWHDRIFMISPEMAERVEKERPILAKKICVNGDGVDLSFFCREKIDVKKMDDVRKQFCGEGLLAVYHGTIEPHHGQEELLAIVQQALAVETSLHFVIIAGGKDYSAVKRELKRDRVHCLDFMSQEALLPYLAAGDVGFLPYPPDPSTNILYPYKFLEYYALGLPVVSFRLKALFRMFEKKSDVRFAETVNEFAEALVELARQKRHREWDEDFSDHFSWQAVVKPIHNALKYA